ncbi:hypothetical protein PFISCL1PPCAC_2574, partial [Pristionchus fissidentatus]
SHLRGSWSAWSTPCTRDLRPGRTLPLHLEFERGVGRLQGFVIGVSHDGSLESSSGGIGDLDSIARWFLEWSEGEGRWSWSVEGILPRLTAPLLLHRHFVCL